jgi:hypothetical protein
MSKQISIPAQITKNHLDKCVIKVDPKLSQEYLSEILKNDVIVDVQLSITKIETLKTNAQLRYFFGVVYPIIKLGLEDIEGITLKKSEVMSILKERFFSEFSFDKNQEIEKSLADASKEELSKFIEAVIKFGEDFLNVTIPEPENINEL